jgi:hypothetical protein
MYVCTKYMHENQNVIKFVNIMYMNFTLLKAITVL